MNMLNKIIQVFVCLLLVQVSQKAYASVLNHSLPIGIYFFMTPFFYDTNSSLEIQNIVEKVTRTINNGITDNNWSIQTIKIEISDSHALVKAICEQMSRGVLAIFGTTASSSFNMLTKFTDFYKIPYISLSYLGHHNNLKSGSAKHSLNNNVEHDLKSPVVTTRTQLNSKDDYENRTEIIDLSSQIYLKPDLAPALIELVKFYEWDTIYFVYNHDNGLMNLERLLEYQNEEKNLSRKILVRRIINIYDCREMLRSIDATLENDPHNQKSKAKIVLIIDLDNKENYMRFLSQVKDIGMTKSRYNFVLSTMGIYELDVNEFRYGGATIIGFSIVDYHNSNSIKLLSEALQPGEPLNKISNIPYEAALFIDGFAYFSKRINSAIGLKMNRLFGIESVSLHNDQIYFNKSKGQNCSFYLENSQKWPLGQKVLEVLKNDDEEKFKKYDGLTGHVKFDGQGKRTGYKLVIYKVSLNVPLTRIGYYSLERGLNLDEKKLSQSIHKNNEKLAERKKIVISILDEPFFMLRNDHHKYNDTDNNRYMGYCVDLTRRLAEIVNFTFEFRLVKDDRFGSRDSHGNWNGMVGELVRNEADLAVAPLTISFQREQAIDFSMPFMNFGISIMIKKPPQTEKPGVLSFMSPLDIKTWLCVILAYLSVSVVLFLVSRFSANECLEEPIINEQKIKQNFTILNTLWFNLAAIMQQGVELTPRSISGRLIASVWWLFSLLLIISYTANLAAILTERIVFSPIESAEQLYHQTEIQYGAVEGGSTKEFFRNSKVDVYKQMWNNMEAWKPNSFVKSTFDGIRKVRESRGKFAFLLESSMNEYLNERRPCDTIKVGSDLDSKAYGVAMPIGSELRTRINLAILQLREEGFLDELKTKWWYDNSECESLDGSSSSQKYPYPSALNLRNVAGPFYILIIVSIMSILVAIFELVYKRIRKP